jgi:Ca-activated chloride channel family protein
MAGLPLDASRRLVRRALAGLRSADRFNLIEFAGGARALADAPLAVTEDALRGAEGFLDHLQGAGGTEMLEGVRAVVEQPFDRAMVRIVCFLTDGLVANEAQILELIRRRGQDARWFAFGIGGSVNRELIEGIAEAGRGACEVVLPDLAAAAEAAAERFFRRLDAPVLSDVTFDRGALPIMDVEPARLPDLFAGEAILVSGRFSEAGAATVHFRARANGREVAIPCAFELPAAPPPRPAIGAHWAGRRIHALTRELAGAEGGAREELRARITDLALEFRLVSPFTSFVAVDEAGGGVGRPPVRVLQPVALPRGMTPDSAHGPALGACVTRVPLWGLTLLELPGDGLVVTDVSADGAAARAGARAGSVLVSVGGNRVLGASHLDALLRRLQGETVAVGFREAGGPETVCRLARPEALER